MTYRVRIGATHLVVRRPPFGQLAPGAHDMRREYRALAGLWPHFDRAPRPYAFCADHDVIGADFLVVEYRRGVVPPDTAWLAPEIVLPFGPTRCGRSARTDWWIRRLAGQRSTKSASSLASSTGWSP